MNKKRKCLCCGKEYSYCPSCNKDRNKPSWMTVYCCENCKTIFDALNNYSFGLITKEEAQKILKSCDLSEKNNFNEVIRQDIEKIMEVHKSKTDKEAKKQQKQTE